MAIMLNTIFDFLWCDIAESSHSAECLLANVFWWERLEYEVEWDALYSAAVHQTDPTENDKHSQWFALSWVAALRNDWQRWDKVASHWKDIPQLYADCLELLKQGRNRQYSKLALTLEKLKENGGWHNAVITTVFTALESSGVNAKPLLSVLARGPVNSPLTALLVSRLLAADGKREAALDLLRTSQKLWPHAACLPWLEATLLAQSEQLFAALVCIKNAEKLGLMDIALLRFWLSSAVSLPRSHAEADIHSIYKRILPWLESDFRRAAEMTSYVLIRHWMDKDVKHIHNLLSTYHAFQDVEEKKEDKAARAFMQLVVQLCLVWQECRSFYPEVSPAAHLYIIGESHCLIPCNTSFVWNGEQILAVPVFIMGAKMWHLAKKDDSACKMEFVTHCGTLPENGRLLLTIGEIDCRPDEGLWSAHKKTGRPLGALIRSTIKGYLDFVERVLKDKKPARITVQGIPAPTVSLVEVLQGRDRSAFIAMIKEVNQVLKHEVLSRDWQFLDVYSATVNAADMSNGKWHLDKVHLHPKFYQECEAWLTPRLQGETTNDVSDKTMQPDESALLSLSTSTPDVATLENLLALYRAGNYPASRERSEQLTRQYPTSSLCWQVLGASLQVLGESEAALAAKIRAAELSPDDPEVHTNLARSFLEVRNFVRAASAVRRALDLRPDLADAHATLGKIYKAVGNKKEAEASIRKAIELNTIKPEYWNDLGLLLFETEESQDAIGVFQQAITIRPDYTDALNNIGLAYSKMGQFELAGGAYLKALQYTPNHVAAHNNLANLYQKQGRVAEAEVHYRQALEHNPDDLDALANLGALLKGKGQIDEAIKCFSHLLHIKPDHSVASHMLNAMTQQTADAAPTEYVAKLFDNYAATFDEALVGRLNYQTPRRLATVLRESTGNRPIVDILDLGCGTGLAGIELYRPEITLVGVDISPKMLEKAAERGVYKRLINSELLEMMRSEPDSSYDLIVAADVFVYIGKLDEIFLEGYRLLRPGGIFAFSVESLDDVISGSKDYMLNPTGRFSHARNYIEGFTVRPGYSLLALLKEPLRMDLGSPIMGWLALLAKPSLTNVSSSTLLQP